MTCGLRFRNTFRRATRANNDKAKWLGAGKASACSKKGQGVQAKAKGFEQGPPRCGVGAAE